MPPIEDPLNQNDDDLTGGNAEEGTEGNTQAIVEPAPKGRRKKDAAAAAPAEDLAAELEKLRAERDAALAARDDALAREAQAVAATAQAQLILSSVQEEYIGKNAQGEPLYKYRIDLAPNGGNFIRLNGVQYFHGQTYTFDTGMLASVKDMVYRTWMHEASIKGSNENFYRKPMNRTLRGRAH